MTAAAKHAPWRNSGLRQYLRQIRITGGSTVAQTARETGYSKTALDSWEKGYVTPALPALLHWAEALGYYITVRPVHERETKKRKSARK